MKKTFLIITTVIILSLCVLGGNNTHPITLLAADNSVNGLLNLYDKDCTDKMVYGQVLNIEYHYPQGMTYFEPYYTVETITGQSSYTSGFIDIRGYTYFATNNDSNFSIICYNASKEPVYFIAQDSTAQGFGISPGDSGSQPDNPIIPPVNLASVSAPIIAYQNTINNKTLVAINETSGIAFVRVAFANSNPSPHFYAFTDDFAMLIKLNRDNTSGGVMNALYMDIFDNLFSGFTMTATDLTFEVGDILKNTINEIIFSVYSPELYFYYTATNGGWQSLLTGISYFSYYMNRTLILNCPTYIAVAPMTIDLTSVEDGGYNLIGDTEPQTPTENTTNFIQNIINNPSFMYIFAIFGGLIVLMLVSTLLGRFK